MKDKKPSQKNQKLEISVPLNRRLLKYIVFVCVFIAILYSIVSEPQKLWNVVSKIVSVISPFIVGFCIAYVVNLLLIPTERLWAFIWRKSKLKIKDKLKRPICLLLSALIVFGAIFAIVFMVIPEFADTVVTFVERIPRYAVTVEGWYSDLAAGLANYNIELPAIHFDTEKVVDMATDFISNYGNSMLNKTVNITASIAGFLFNLILGIAFSIYVLAQKERLGRQANDVIYAVFSRKSADRILGLTTLTNRVFTKFVSGQLTEAVIIGILCFIGMLIFGMPYAPLISVLVGFTALVPIFGAFIGTGIGAFLILLESPVKAVWFVVFIIILQQLEGNLIYPKVVGKSVGLPGVWVLVAVTVGGGTFGVLGMLFAVPICSVLYVIFKEYIEKRLVAKKAEVQDIQNDIQE